MRRSTWTTKLAVAGSVLILLLFWEFGARVVDARVILPAPGETAVSFWSIVNSKPFSVNIWATVNRALQSFLIITASGMVLGILAGYSPILQAMLKPLLVVFKATPVMSVILLAFIWFSSGTVPLFSAFLMGFPVMFIQVERGVRQISPRLTEMTRMYGFSSWMRLTHLVVPSLMPSVITGAKASLSMVWKVVIAAEVLTVPRYGIGSRMQLSQVNLETASVLAWTLIAVLLTACTDVLFELLLRFPSWYVKRRHARLKGLRLEDDV